MSMVSDHFKKSTVAALHRERPSIRWACCEWMVQPLLEAGVDKRVIDVLAPMIVIYYHGLGHFEAVKVPHNVPNCGWKLNDGRERLFYCTDVSSLSGIEAKNCDYYMIESNHTHAEIQARIAAKQAAGEFAYEIEASRNHLSFEQALDWLAANMGPNSQYIFLHQHKERRK